MKRIRVVFLLLVTVGCSGSSSGDQPISLDQVPAAIREAAEKERAKSLPDVKFESATKRRDGSFEIRGKGKNGKIRDVELDANGKLIEIE